MFEPLKYFRVRYKCSAMSKRNYHGRSDFGAGYKKHRRQRRAQCKRELSETETKDFSSVQDTESGCAATVQDTGALRRRAYRKYFMRTAGKTTERLAVFAVFACAPRNVIIIIITLDIFFFIVLFAFQMTYTGKIYNTG